MANLQRQAAALECPVTIIGEHKIQGFEREQHWRFARYLADGALNPELKDPKGEIAKYEVVLNKYPNDSRGLGVLTVQYTDARLPDVDADELHAVRLAFRKRCGQLQEYVHQVRLRLEGVGLSLPPDLRGRLRRLVARVHRRESLGQ